MSDTNTSAPLVEWNRLNKENTEHGLVSALYQSVTETSPLVDKFSLWLLAGTGATGALLITQINSILPFLTQSGFKTCLIILVISAIVGFIAKYFSLHCQIQSNIQSKLVQLVEPIFDKHGANEEIIHEYAEQQGIELQTEININTILIEFAKPFPAWVRWLISRKTKNKLNDRQASFHIAVKAYMSQLYWTLLQAVLFLMFILVAAWYANAI